ncbi:MAG: DNA repair protein RadC [Lachnospiraceae bacterium]
MYKTTMKELPLSERPYEKCEAHGPESLSDKELLTVLIRTGTKKERADEVALRLLSACGKGGLSELSGMNAAQLKKIGGIGRVKALQLQCVCELAKRIASGKRLLGTKISSPEEIAAYYGANLRYHRKEVLILIVLDTKSRVVAEEVLSLGTVNTSIADPREIFLAALKHQGVSIILLHNHPSGDPEPSIEDIKTTERVRDAGKLLGIFLQDHIIIGQDSYVSLRADGYLNFLG